MSDLDRLIATVEAGVPFGADDICTLTPIDWHLQGLCVEVANAYSGSLDAALRLLNALLPGYHWSVAEDDDYGFCGKVFCNGWHHEHSKIASRALLLAILRALKAQEARG